MKAIILSALFLVMAVSANAQVKNNKEIESPQAPVTVIEVMEMSEESAEGFISNWKSCLQTMGQQDGFITSTLYKSVQSDFKYRIVSIALWQSYEAWVAADKDCMDIYRLGKSLSQRLDMKLTDGFYRPVNFTVNTTNNYPANNNDRLDTRVSKDSTFPNPGEPFVFINLMEMNKEDAANFVADARERSKVMGQLQGAIGATLYQSVLPDSKFRIVNVSQWQSYDSFINANNQPTYSSQLTTDLGHTPSIKLNRGFFRPVATYTHIYD